MARIYALTIKLNTLKVKHLIKVSVPLFFVYCLVHFLKRSERQRTTFARGWRDPSNFAYMGNASAKYTLFYSQNPQKPQLVSSLCQDSVPSFPL